MKYFLIAIFLFVLFLFKDFWHWLLMVFVVFLPIIFVYFSSKNDSPVIDKDSRLWRFVSSTRSSTELEEAGFSGNSVYFLWLLCFVLVLIFMWALGNLNEELERERLEKEKIEKIDNKNIQNKIKNPR